MNHLKTYNENNLELELIDLLKKKKKAKIKYDIHSLNYTIKKKFAIKSIEKIALELVKKYGIQSDILNLLYLKLPIPNYKYILIRLWKNENHIQI